MILPTSEQIQDVFQYINPFFKSDIKMFLYKEISNPTPFVEYDPLPSGTNETPNLTNVTRGQRQSSKIFHTKSNGKYYWLKPHFLSAIWVK